MKNVLKNHVENCMNSSKFYLWNQLSAIYDEIRKDKDENVQEEYSI